MHVNKHRRKQIMLETSAIVHLEPKEFIEMACNNHKEISARAYVLDTGVAGIVYMFQGNDGYLYYLDRFNGAKEVTTDPYALHAELYRKVALDQRLRMH